MGCLPWLIGGLAWLVVGSVSDNGWIGFGTGISVWIATAVIADRYDRRGKSSVMKLPRTTNVHQVSYLSHCWYCKSPITSAMQRKCTKCGWYICDVCSECGCRYKRFVEARNKRL